MRGASCFTYTNKTTKNTFGPTSSECTNTHPARRRSLLVKDKRMYTAVQAPFTSEKSAWTFFRPPPGVGVECYNRRRQIKSPVVGLPKS